MEFYMTDSIRKTWFASAGNISRRLSSCKITDVGTSRYPVTVASWCVAILVMVLLSGDTLARDDSIQLVVLGIAQDAGFPQSGCQKNCCKLAWKDDSLRRRVASLGLIDHSTGQRWLFDCSPDFPDQLRSLNSIASEVGNRSLQQSGASISGKASGANAPVRKPKSESESQISESQISKSQGSKFQSSESQGSKSQSSKSIGLESQAEKSKSSKPRPPIDGIFLTHAHIGHYSGLIHLGREAMGTNDIPTHVMPRMQKFLQTNGPWSQLVTLKNIELKPMQVDKPVVLNDRIVVTPFQVPHRDEFSETVGFKIRCPGKTVVFLPDIDKWSRWNRSIEDLIKEVDPHPFVAESIIQFSALDETERKKVRFIHFNHTNPLLQTNGVAAKAIRNAGMGIAVEGEIIEMATKE
jgi:pyrroloquinoline quinone biosynthesis protein B